MWICTSHVIFLAQQHAQTALSPCQLNFNTFYEAHWMCCHFARTFRMQYHPTSFDSFLSKRRALYTSLVLFVSIKKDGMNGKKPAFITLSSVLFHKSLFHLEVTFFYKNFFLHFLFHQFPFYFSYWFQFKFNVFGSLNVITCDWWRFLEGYLFSLYFDSFHSVSLWAFRSLFLVFSVSTPQLIQNVYQKFSSLLQQNRTAVKTIANDSRIFWQVGMK